MLLQTSAKKNQTTFLRKTLLSFKTRIKHTAGQCKHKTQNICCSFSFSGVSLKIDDLSPQPVFLTDHYHRLTHQTPLTLMITMKVTILSDKLCFPPLIYSFLLLSLFEENLINKEEECHQMLKTVQGLPV